MNIYVRRVGVLQRLCKCTQNLVLIPSTATGKILVLIPSTATGKSLVLIPSTATGKVDIF